MRANVEVPTKRGKGRGEVAEECEAKLELRRKEKQREGGKKTREGEKKQGENLREEIHFD